VALSNVIPPLHIITSSAPVCLTKMLLGGKYPTRPVCKAIYNQPVASNPDLTAVKCYYVELCPCGWLDVFSWRVGIAFDRVHGLTLPIIFNEAISFRSSQFPVSPGALHRVCPANNSHPVNTYRWNCRLYGYRLLSYFWFIPQS